MLLQLEKEDDVDIKQYQKYMVAYTDYEDREDLVINNESKNRLVMVIYENQGQRDEEKYLLYSKRWYLYARGKISLINGLYWV